MAEKDDEKPIYKWIHHHYGDENFNDALKKLLAFAIFQKMNLEQRVVASPENALRLALEDRDFGARLTEYLNAPLEHAHDITAFCDGKNPEPLPEALFKNKTLNEKTHFDLRGVPCPKSSVRARLIASCIQKNEDFELWIDDGAPIENVPSALIADGCRIFSRKKNLDYWVLNVVK